MSGIVSRYLPVSLRKIAFFLFLYYNQLIIYAVGRVERRYDQECSFEITSNGGPGGSAIYGNIERIISFFLIYRREAAKRNCYSWSPHGKLRDIV